MIVWSYILCCPDDQDTLADAINSLAQFSNRIYLVDGGNVSLIHRERYATPIKDWLKSQYKYSNGKWLDSELVMLEHEFTSYGPQRNWLLEYLNAETSNPDWLVWIDSDEVCSWQMANGIKYGELEQFSGKDGVYVKWLNLVQDEQHCVAGSHSDWLSHPRIVKVGNHYWSGTIHEHMVIDRGNIARWDVRVVHSRALFRRRLMVQRGHPNIRNRPDPLWDDAVIEPIPPGVTWKIHWPSEEKPLPIDQDAREVWDESGNPLAD